MSWADATANPANKAAVLTNSCFLMEWSSSSSRFPCGPMRGDSQDNDLNGAQFRRRASVSPRPLAVCLSILGNQIFARDLWKSVQLVQRKIAARFHPRSNRRPAHKGRAQRRCRALLLWAGIAALETPLSRSCKLRPLQQSLNVGGDLTSSIFQSRREPSLVNRRIDLVSLTRFKRAKSKLPPSPMCPNP
jgi:hypothetical protein